VLFILEERHKGKGGRLITPLIHIPVEGEGRILRQGQDKINKQ